MSSFSPGDDSPSPPPPQTAIIAIAPVSQRCWLTPTCNNDEVIWHRCLTPARDNEFMTKLVYDLIFPGNTSVHLSTIGELNDWSIDSTMSFLLFASVKEMQLEEADMDLNCDSGRRA